MSAYYPVVLTGASLIVCFWAEVFHLQEIRWDRPRFLSKSFLGFVTFNVISYSLLIAELLLIWFGQEHLHFYTHIFNGCYAVLMFIVVIFFLIYGVEVFFKVSFLSFKAKLCLLMLGTPVNCFICLSLGPRGIHGDKGTSGDLFRSTEKLQTEFSRNRRPGGRQSLRQRNG